MKRMTAILICLCIALTGCQSKTKVVTEVSPTPTVAVEADTDTKNNEVTEDNSETEPQETPIESLETVRTPFTMEAYTAEVAPYTVAEDLSNIENLNQFTGFTKEQIKMLSENGFVVLPSTDTRMYYVYDSNEYLNVPNFITSDSVLHLYHQFYDKSLMAVETGFLYKDLDLLTKQMLDNSISLLSMLTEEDLISLQEKNVTYFLVARMVILQSKDVDVKVASEIKKLAEQEYDLIQAAEGYAVSPLLQTDFDYSQCKVRGHYTKTEELGKFFKTMMWFGTAASALTNKEGEYNYENTLQSLLVAYTTFTQANETSNSDLWSDIYLPTVQYVGESDDITVFDMNSLRVSVFGDTEDPNTFNDEGYKEKLQKAVEALPEPQIQGDYDVLTTPSGRQFRFMGQRYLLDSDVMQTLIDTNDRPIPSALDVMGTLGSGVAEDLLFNVYKPQEIWPEYTEKYQKLEKEIAAYTTDTWGENLYNGWLWSIQETLTEYDATSGMPSFMTNDAWKYKSLNAALGSYTELKHDTVLYGKQASAEMGGPLDYKVASHYVEPDVALYCKLLYLTNYSIEVLQNRSMMNADLLEGATKYQKLLTLLITCSMKELKNETLSEEDNQNLLWYGGTMESIMNSFLLGSTGSYEDKEICDMLVTDVSTYMNNYLTLGTGYFDYIYVVIPVKGKLYLSRGSVYSSYEFVSSTRYTDEEWWNLQGITVKKEDYGSYLEMGEPSKLLPEQPSWVSIFKSDRNDIAIKSMETLFEDLAE